MLTIEQEYKQWLENYELLLHQLKAAWRFRNKKKIEELNKRILNTQVQIAMCARKLKKQSDSNSNSPRSVTIGRNVKIGKYFSVNFESIVRSWLK